MSEDEGTQEWPEQDSEALDDSRSERFKEERYGEGSIANKRAPVKRKFFIDLEKIASLDTLEGQNQLILEVEKLLATAPLNIADRQALKLLIDTVKVKKDIDVLRVAAQFEQRLSTIDSRLQSVEQNRIKSSA